MYSSPPLSRGYVPRPPSGCLKPWQYWILPIRCIFLHINAFSLKGSTLWHLSGRSELPASLPCALQPLLSKTRVTRTQALRCNTPSGNRDGHEVSTWQRLCPVRRLWTKGRFTSRAGWNRPARDFYHTTRNGAQFKTYKNSLLLELSI